MSGLSDLRDKLDALSAADLEAIGVKITKPNPTQWLWLRDLMADALVALDRRKAGETLREFPFCGVRTNYSIGISVELLSEMARRIEQRMDKNHD